MKIWDRQTPPPSVGPKSQIFPKIRFEGFPKGGISPNPKGFLSEKMSLFCHKGGFYQKKTENFSDIFAKREFYQKKMRIFCEFFAKRGGGGLGKK